MAYQTDKGKGQCLNDIEHCASPRSGAAALRGSHRALIVSNGSEMEKLTLQYFAGNMSRMLIREREHARQ